MFRGGQTNSYDEVVAKTTDENLTGENWEMILNLCDKVLDEGEQGARNVVAAVLKRLAHRNPNVQLYTLTLAESLTKNCGIEVHREIASRAFTQGLEKLVTDRTTHEKVRRRVLSMIAMWTAEFEKDPTLGIMEESFESLKSKGYKFETPDEPPPPDVDDEVRRREEEELQRVLEMSMHDKGGRQQWADYSLASSNGAGGSGSNSNLPATNTAQPTRQQQSYTQPSYGGYVPSASPAISAANTSSPSTLTTVSSSTMSSAPPSASGQENISVVTRVRALHTFEPTEAGELAFEKGDIIKVVDRGYKDWWRGQLKGRTGIFPVNYVEPLPEPTAVELAREAEQEATVFAQAANVDRLLTLLRGMDPAKDNLADNEEIQELYRNCMTLRPRIVKLIDKYSQKRADLVSMNETFVKARTIFDRMMEESLARNTAMYDPRPPYAQPQSSYIARPDSRGRQEYGMPPGPQPYGYSPAGYDQGYSAYPPPQPGYVQGPERAYSPGARPQSTYDPNAYAQISQTMYGQPQVYGAPTSYGGQAEPQIYPAGQPTQPAQAQHQPHPQAQATPFQQVAVPMQTQPTPTPQVQVQAQPQPQVQPQPQPQTQAQPQPQAQAQVQAQTQPQPQPQRQSGPPFVFDPNTTYPDPNVQAWAQYYAQGGTDPTGSIYFISVPGVKEGSLAQTVSRSDSQDTAVAQQAQASTTSLNASTPQSQSAGESGTAHAGFEGGQQQAPGSPTASVHQQPAYGVSPYGVPPAGYTASPAPGISIGATQGEPQQGVWQAQYQGLPNQFAGMQVSGEPAQASHPGPQGVGAPA
ncbi:uncharacterized protein C8Q71DRAFT_703083 [Rhodofomes roseus]|uniref:Class E vacuolar protein-sorting machinery protein HSE1 n=1 Tax=Rhodofomes roseus TaxID=34475 RepID=A0ABQ8KPY6_9APHY|nr:uncharacterized protein C8Q71DRAFT_703083 [Rhodofomes roseus]KAH9839976.1 hypothetical protein C8Q71DRAFT_703083 [Rhodofomes roseus]